MLLRPLLSLASHNSYGYGICMRDVRHAAGQRAAQFAADKGEWDWHPVAIERTRWMSWTAASATYVVAKLCYVMLCYALHFDHTLSVAPVCVCVRESCFDVRGVGWRGRPGVRGFAGW